MKTGWLASALTRGLFVASFAGALVSPKAVAQAQGITPAPYPAVFGGVGGGTAPRQNVDMTVVVMQGYDTGDAGAQTVPGTLDQGAYSALMAGGNLGWRFRRLQLAATAGTNVRYEGETGRLRALSHAAGLGLSTPLGRRATLTVNQAATYTPAFLQGFAAPTAAATDLATTMPQSTFDVDQVRSYVDATNVTITRGIGRRGSLALKSGLYLTGFINAPDVQRLLKSYDVGGAYTQGLTKDLGLVLGYTYKSWDFPGGDRPVEHQINAGLDYHRAVVLARHTTFTSTVGSTLVSGAAATGTATTTSTGNGANQRQFQLRGGAELAHQLGRTAHFGAVYKREVSYLEAFGTPVLTNGVTTALKGFLGRGTDYAVSANYTDGNSALDGTAAFKTYSGTVTLRRAISRSWALTADYQYYSHDLARTTGLIGGVPTRLGHHAVRVGCALWIPVRRK